jgi:hypothetical protein
MMTPPFCLPSKGSTDWLDSVAGCSGADQNAALARWGTDLLGPKVLKQWVRARQRQSGSYP